MKFKRLVYIMLFSFFMTGLVKADVTTEDFIAKTTQNLINLCTASPNDSHYKEAIHFCHGYLVGAYHFHQAQAANQPERKLFCPQNPAPSRNEAIKDFIAWAKQHPEFMNEMPVETEFRFLIETSPCKK